MKFVNHLLYPFILLLSSIPAAGQQDKALLKDTGWTYHFQMTGIIQAHPSFKAAYSGQNSLNNASEKAYSVTATLFLGRQLWPGASLYFNPEMAGGRGISSTLGIAGFPNGETFRIGDPEPVVYVARIFFRQHISLDKEHFEITDDGPNSIKEKLSTSRITISFGKLAMPDFFDGNSFSHDPRTQFMNWALMNNGAFDYAANTRGYTYGFIAEYIKPGWSLRIGTALVPVYANGPDFDFHYFKSHSENLEWEKKYEIHGREGRIRLLGYYNVSRAPNYDDVVAEKISGTDTSMDVIHGKKYGGKKIGFGLNGEQEISGAAGIFFRFGWNDGKAATWVFTEIDNSISAGLHIAGNGWNRAADHIGIAFLSNGISAQHRNFLKAGGYGFIIGDGQLPRYQRETIAEVYYRLKIFSNLWATVDGQVVVNPAYNPDRGPVYILSARVHVEF